MSESDVYTRQILTYKACPGAEKINLEESIIWRRQPVMLI